MTNNRLIILSIAAIITQTVAEDKWIWSKEVKTGTIQSDTTKISVAKPVANDAQPASRRNDAAEQSRFLIDDDLRRARYEVQELTDPNSGWATSPNRPFSYRPFVNRPPPPPLPDRFPPPLPDRLPPLLPDQLPSPIDYNPQTAGNEQPPIRRQPPPQSVGILTGPIPSWEKPTLHKNGDPTNFEHCKCSFSFNCKSPGIQFGSCDQGKTYCCYNDLSDKNGHPPTGPNAFGSTNVDRYDRLPSILVGPGGPIDDRRPGLINQPGPPKGHGYGPYRPTYDETDEEFGSSNYNQKPYPIIPQKPVLPPYMGLHNDYRSS